MNRIIKFRAWGKLSPEREETINDWNYIKPMCFMNVETGNWEFMQFTGLKDKNGKDIYEGDILKNTKHKDQLVEVYWKGCIKDGGEINGEDWINWGGWHFRKVDKTSKEVTYAIYNSEIEIIGNIYENPELLEIKNNK